MHPIRPRVFWILVLAVSCIATAAIYWKGLYGPQLFDDFWNFAPIERWFDGEQTLTAAILPNRESIVHSRPVAMASFALTAGLGGNTVFALKLGNLLLHLACGGLACWIFVACFRLDASLSTKALPLGVFLATVWLLHPMHVSTVLYGVQRMAQLSALSMLACMALYLGARHALEKGEHLRANILLFVLLPLVWLAGVLSKQNAIMAGLLCAVLEFAYFRTGPRPPAVRFFLVAFAAVPVLAGFLLLAIAPQRLLGGYAELEFTLWERVLTQPRALLDYITTWFFPRTPALGLYTDAYPISSGLLSPPSTIVAIVALGLLSLLSVALRRRMPTLFAGWWIFLVAHAVESSFLPLEMYYEHRNYLPSVGLLMAAASLGAWAIRYAYAQAPRLQRTLPFAALAFCAVLAFATLGRVTVWQNEYLMTEQGLRFQPESIRARLDRLSLQIKADDYSAARSTLDKMRASGDPRKRIVSGLDLFALDCAEGHPPDPTLLVDARREAQPRLTVYEVHAALFLVEVASKNNCGEAYASNAAAALAGIVDAATAQPDTAANKTTIRRTAAQLHYLAGDWADAREQALLGWNAQRTLPIGSLLAMSTAEMGDVAGAMKVLDEMKSMARPFDKVWQSEIERLRQAILQSQDDVVNPPTTAGLAS